MAQDEAHDWELVARRDPYFGVVSVEEFRTGRMTAETKRRFYEGGETDIARVLAWFDADLGARPTAGCALDIGCGVGRLTSAMARSVPQVAGYDISETMVALARAEAPPNATFATALPAGPFSWINSYLVFQHITPAEGLDLLEQCLARAAPDCFLSIQITGWRDGPKAMRNPIARLRRWLIHQSVRKAGGPADRLIRMHDYDFSEVVRRITAAGFERMVLRHTHHVGSHGAWIIARRGPGTPA
jgi:SAM-dependent methyltransferase